MHVCFLHVYIVSISLCSKHNTTHCSCIIHGYWCTYM